ncbi:MAG: tRNA (N(6)-L-threonylcarbamoyladenosine(37)-C(2))-methylthiotransferase MtaB [Candidatus Methylomirabilales bacterium]
MRIGFTTLGCRLNQFETDVMADQARTAGFTLVPFHESAEVYVVNTCTVTERADADARRLVRQAIRRNPMAFVVVTGCYAQAAPERIAAIEGVDLILGNAEKMELMRHLRGAAWESQDLAAGYNGLNGNGRETGLTRPRFLGTRVGQRQGGKARISVGNIGEVRTFHGAPAPERPDRTRPFLKIQDGCRFACTFCIIPAVRGPNRSLHPDHVVAEAQRLAAAGHPEIVLTGINLGTYGWDLRPKISLSALVRRLLKDTAVPRFRLSSLHPHEVKPEIIRLMGDSSRLCRHIHLALQSGDDEILRRMGRSYRSRQFREVVERLHQEVPGIAIGVDVIVGFPGETEAAFENTQSLLEQLPVAYFHVFTYSRRSGTKAAEMSDQVAPDVKARRNRILRDLGARKFLAFKREVLGRTLPVVVLEERDRQTDLLQGVSDNYLGVLFQGPDVLKGKLLDVRVERLDPGGMLLGRLPDARPVAPSSNRQRVPLLMRG